MFALSLLNSTGAGLKDKTINEGVFLLQYLREDLPAAVMAPA
jgi:hypothetical protein